MRIHDLLEGAPTLNSEDVEKIRDLYLAGKSIEEIARILNKNPGPVRGKVNQLFPDRKRQVLKVFTVDELEKIKELHLKGVSLVEIGKILNRNPEVLGRKIKELFPDSDRKVQIPVSPEEETEIIRLYKEGVGVTEITRRLKRSPTAISRVIDKFFPTRTKKISNPTSKTDIETIKNLYDAGVNPAEIAKRTGKTTSLISIVIDRLYPNRTKKTAIPLTTDDFEAVKQLYNNGLTPSEIAKKINRSHSVVNKILNKLYPDREKRISPEPVSNDEIEKIKQLYIDGDSPTKIAKKFGRTTSTITRIIDTFFKGREKIIKTPFSEDEIQLTRKQFQSGVPQSQISIELDRPIGSISQKIRSMPDYESVLLPAHLENRQQKWGVSYAETAFFDHLSQIAGIPNFERNVRIKRDKYTYNIDAVGPGKIAIEFFGDLWHANPEKYPDDDQILFKLGLTAGEVRKKDRKKIEWLEQQGYHVVVIWENEWTKKSTRQACIDRVLAALNKK
jgi:IS30 family transposase